MNRIRRQMLKVALAAAALLATPASLYAAARRSASQRFLWIRLKGTDNILSIDTWENDRAYLLTGKQALKDGSYRLKDGRAMEVKNGRLVQAAR